MIVIAGSFRLDAGVTDDVMAACKTVMQATHQEEGCYEYIFYPDPLDNMYCVCSKCGKMNKH